MDALTPHKRFVKDIDEVLHYNSCVLAMVQKSGATLASEFITYTALFQEFTYCRIVDCYLRFVAEVLSALYALKPEMLRSNEKVTVEFIINHRTMEELVNSLIERKVLDLGYESLKGLAKYFEDKLQLPLFSSDTELNTAALAIEIRNVYVHNRGVVNRTFRSRVPSFVCNIGETLDLGGLGVEHSSLLLHAAADLAKRIGEKFDYWI